MLYVIRRIKSKIYYIKPEKSPWLFICASPSRVYVSRAYRCYFSSFGCAQKKRGIGPLIKCLENGVAGMLRNKCLKNVKMRVPTARPYLSSCVLWMCNIAPRGMWMEKGNEGHSRDRHTLVVNNAIKDTCLFFWANTLFIYPRPMPTPYICILKIGLGRREAKRKILTWRISLRTLFAEIYGHPFFRG